MMSCTCWATSSNLMVADEELAAALAAFCIVTLKTISVMTEATTRINLFTVAPLSTLHSPFFRVQ